MIFEALAWGSLFGSLDSPGCPLEEQEIKTSHSWKEP